MTILLLIPKMTQKQLRYLGKREQTGLSGSVCFAFLLYICGLLIQETENRPLSPVSYRAPRMVASICAWASFCWCLSIFSMCTSGCAVTLMCAGFQVPYSSKKW